MTQILDFLESSPLLHTIDIMDSIPNSSDAPPERIVTPGHLKTLTITTDTVNCIFKHFRIPVGASLKVIAHPGVEEFPLLEYLRGISPNIENLSCITAINLLFGPYAKYAKLSGPSGSLCLCGWWGNPTIPSIAMDDRILRALSPRILSTTERLTFSDCKHPEQADVEEWPIFRTLLSTNILQTLVLSRCDNQLFISALNPGKNSSEVVLCPSLKKLILFVELWVSPIA